MLWQDGERNVVSRVDFLFVLRKGERHRFVLVLILPRDEEEEERRSRFCILFVLVRFDVYRFSRQANVFECEYQLESFLPALDFPDEARKKSPIIHHHQRHVDQSVNHAVFTLLHLVSSEIVVFFISPLRDLFDVDGVVYSLFVKLFQLCHSM